MPPLALVLILAAAALHAGWNYLTKAARDAVGFLWWALLLGSAGYSLYIIPAQGIYLPRQVWLLYAVSLACEVGYLITLVRGYQDGDLSLVYPLSRGSAPIFIAVWSALLIGERLPPLGYLGIALMIAGLFVASQPPGKVGVTALFLVKFQERVARALRLVTGSGTRGCGGLSPRKSFVSPSPALRESVSPRPTGGEGRGEGDRNLPALDVAESGEEKGKSAKGVRTAALWALASGIFISIYSLADKVIVGAMSPLVYNWWVYAGMTVAWSPLVWLSPQRAAHLEELRRNWPRVVIGSVMTIGAYVAVLVAYTLTSASYVVAGRGTSVIIGAVLGWLALGESVGRVRVIGALLMVAGLAIITFAR